MLLIIFNKFQTFDQITEFQPHFRILTQFQNFNQFSEIQPNFRIATNDMKENSYAPKTPDETSHLWESCLAEINFSPWE